ncbi:hypothetical protein ACMHYO_11510 [Allopusillimonas ginsengisoli]|uniref:hypothetical protein n=1 Tax=Allopusillimonas ginsengisoli TaxID=453575 RepID=UPI0039C2D14B
MTKPYSWIVRFDVAPEWVADGFNLTDERALEMLAETLPYANMSYELAARVLAAPSALRIVREQGYTKAHPQAGKEVAGVLDGAPYAYDDMKKRSDAVTLDKAISDAITLLDSVAFVRDENDNTADVLSRLRGVRDMVRGDAPISEIEWQPTPA